MDEHLRHITRTLRDATVAAAFLAIGALAPAAAALAQPASDAAASRNERSTAVARDHDPRTAPGRITFSNLLARSRGPGAGAGLL